MKYKCTKCGELKQDGEFYSYNGIRKGSCKKCDCEYSKRYRERLDIEFYGDWIEEINAIAWNKRENALFKLVEEKKIDRDCFRAIIRGVDWGRDK